MLTLKNLHGVIDRPTWLTTPLPQNLIELRAEECYYCQKGRGEILLLVRIPSASALLNVSTLSPELMGGFDQTYTDTLLRERKGVIVFW